MSRSSVRTITAVRPSVAAWLTATGWRLKGTLDMCFARGVSDLVWSDGLLKEARQTRDEVAASLAKLGVPGELVLIGGTSVSGALTKGDIDLHLRVRVDEFGDAVARLARLYPPGSLHFWADTLAVFDIPRTPATGLAVTPLDSEHDLRFRSTWQALRRRPELMDEYNAIKRAASETAAYEQRKSAFFTSIATSDFKAE